MLGSSVSVHLGMRGAPDFGAACLAKGVSLLHLPQAAPRFRRGSAIVFAVSRLIAIIDTMFARVDMGTIVETSLKGAPGYGELFQVVRTTVPGLKDIPVEVKVLIEDEGAAIVVACGWVGGADLDLQTAQVASLGLMATQLTTNTHVLEVFVHEREKATPQELGQLCEERCRMHALNALNLLFARERLIERAGHGVRQGEDDAGPLLQ